MERIWRRLGWAALAAMFLGMAVMAWTTPAGAVRIKDIASIAGVRPNQLMGYGLVVGLDKSGDGASTRFTVESVVSMLKRLGIPLDSTQVKTGNVAAVMVTATLPPFARAGSRIDVLVSSLGDAKNLQDRKSTRLNSSHIPLSRMPSSA